MSRLLIAATMIATVALGTAAGLAAAAGAGGTGLSLSVPAHTDTDTSFALALRLPTGVAAVDGRVLFDTAAAELVGVAPAGAGSALAPVEINGGAAFGAYGLRATNGHTLLNIVLAPHTDGQLHFRVVIDAVADASGARIALKGAKASGTITMGSGTSQFALPADRARELPAHGAAGTRDLAPDGRVGLTDLDVIRAGWEQARSNDAVCGSLAAAADANSDGCVDVVDIQALVADQGWPTAGGIAVNPAQARGVVLDPSPAARGAGVMAAASGSTFTVTSTADTADAKPGDGICADSQGRCTLRAAITEANWQRGDNRIEFNLPGTAPVTIQLSTSLPQFLINDRSGGMLIDGYSQPGSHVNTATAGSNAIPGVYLVGTGTSPRNNGFRITSANNTIRGIIFNKHDRAIVMDGADAHDNKIIGDWIGYTANGSASSFKGHYNFWISNGANHNVVGTPALADRNVTGDATKGLALYGPGTDYNVIQNNVLCITPSGTSTATCDVGTDFTFGPKNNLIGGSGANEGNVYGASTQQCIEFAHDNGVNGTDQYKNNNNSIIGNWLGFRADGSYNSSFRCGSNTPSNSSNDSNGINLADGSSYNVVQGNWIASWWDGVNIEIGNETGNVVQGNVIGQSPLGQAAPLGRYGVNFRVHARDHTIVGNTIRNAAVYGIALNGPDIVHIRMSQNIITDMSGPAIYLAPDPNNPTTGANGLTPAPVISSATTVTISGTGIPGATVEVYRASRPAGQSGLPVEYLGSAVVAGSGTWSVPVSLQTGQGATALQITPSNNTSALGVNVAAVYQPPPPAPVAAFTWSQEAGNLTVDFTDTSTGIIGQRTWDFGDSVTSTDQNPKHTYATAGDYTVSLTVSNAGGSNSKTSLVSVQAPVANTIAADAFSRSTSNSWGSADIGGLYTVQGTIANYSVAGGVGLIAVPAGGITRSALLNDLSQSNVDIRFRVALDKVATGGAYFVYAVARRNSNNEYRPQLIFKANGSVSVQASVLIGGSESSLGAAVVVPGVTQAVGAFIWVHAQITGANPTTVRINAWADGQPEPAGWLFSATNSAAAVQSAGAVGLRTYVASAATNAPVTFSFDDYSVSLIQP
jgi:CSLREA domain-containing protein